MAEKHPLDLVPKTPQPKDDPLAHEARGLYDPTRAREHEDYPVGKLTMFGVEYRYYRGHPISAADQIIIALLQDILDGG